MPARVAVAEALRNIAKDPSGALSVVIGYSMIPYYRGRIKGAGSAKWHTAASSKAIDYQQLRSSF